MNRNTLIGLMMLGVLALNRATSGAFDGWQTVLHAEVMTAAGPNKVWRIYARFTDGADRLLSWGGSPQTLTLLTVGCEPFWPTSTCQPRGRTRESVSCRAVPRPTGT